MAFLAALAIMGSGTALAKTPTSTALASSMDRSIVGQSTTLTATVTPSDVIGTINFRDGTTLLGSAAVSGGVATLAHSFTKAGNRSLTAKYAGSATYASSTSAVVVQTVTAAPTTLSLSSSVNPVAVGKSVVLRATITPATAGGVITFMQDNTVLGTDALSSSGKASLSRKFAASGIFNLTAVYAGTTHYLGSTSAPVSQTVRQVATSTALASSTNPTIASQSTVLRAKVTPSGATGTVTFKQGTTDLGQVAVIGGLAKLERSFSAVAKLDLTAIYSGDAKYTASTSRVLVQTIAATPTALNLSSSVNPVPVGQPTLLSANITPATAGGVITFKQNSTVLGTATLSSGKASLSKSFAAAGTYKLTAVYAGNTDFRASTSARLSQTVGGAAVTLPEPQVSPAPVVNLEYDAQGNLTRIIQAPGVAGFGFSTQNGYDALERHRTITDARSGVTQIAYDALGRPTSVTDPRNLATQSPRNGLGDVTQLASPDTGTATHTYDALGNLTTRMDSRGVLATYSYDTLDRLTEIVYSKPGDAPHVIGWAYDQKGVAFSNGIGRLTSSSHPAGASQHSYDAQGRVLKTTQRIAAAPGANTSELVQSVAYGYDAAGNTTSITYPSGRVVTLGYAAGKPESISLSPGGPHPAATLLSGIHLMPFGGGVATWQWHYASGTRDNSRLFDTSGRLVRYQLADVVRDLSYDAADRIVGYKHYALHAGAATPEATTLDQSFNYDEVGRITSISRPSGRWSIAYDTNGNRTNVVYNGNGRNYTVDSNSNRLLGVSNPLLTYSHDLAGNVVGLGDATAQYDLSGRWARMDAGGSTTYFTYDAFGQRVRKFSNAGSHTAVFFMYDQSGQLLGEYDVTGAPIREYVWLGTIPVAMFIPVEGGGNLPEVFFIHADHLGAPRAVTDKNMMVRWRWMAEPFGSDAPQEDPSSLGKVTLPLRFPGQYADVESGTYYNYFRDYDPWAGRYLQSDPIGLAGGINTYNYVEGNPLSYTDSYGLMKRPSGGSVRPMYPPIGPAAIPSTHGHHSGPMFMGFSRGQELTPLARPVHEALHRDLNNFMRNQTNEFGQHMRPQRNNSGSDIQRNFSRDQRFEAMREFYNRYGEHYPQAARDFSRQFPDQSFCGR